MNIGEVYAYAEGARLLVASDFLDAIMFPGMYKNPTDPVVPVGWPMNAVDGNPNTVAHSDPPSAPIASLTLVLKRPTRLTQVNVLNRQDCCQGRLDGASLILKNSMEGVIMKQTLRGVKELQLFPVTYT